MIRYLVILLFFGCSYPGNPLWEIVDPVDPVDPEPLVVDSCEFLTVIDTPTFTTLAIYFFNGSPITNQWHWQGLNMTFDSVVELLEFVYPQFEYTYYENDNSVAVIVDGLSDNNLFQGKIWTRDAIQQKAFMTSFGQSFLWYGALTWDEAMQEAKLRPSVKSFHYTNTLWTPEQNNAYARVILHPELCKQGEDRADFHFGLGILQSVKDSFELFEWQFVIDLEAKYAKS